MILPQSDQSLYFIIGYYEEQLMFNRWWYFGDSIPWQWICVVASSYKLLWLLYWPKADEGDEFAQILQPFLRQHLPRSVDSLGFRTYDSLLFTSWNSHLYFYLSIEEYRQFCALAVGLKTILIIQG